MQLLRQLNDTHRAQANNYWNDYAWDKHENDEPMVLPDTGAKDGLCGDAWALHAAEWVLNHGHGRKHKFDKLKERINVSGVGAGSQSAEDQILLPVGLQGTDGKHHLSHYRAAVVRNSNIPALLGIDSLTRLNAVIRCSTGEIWFMDSKGCDVTPKGDSVHLQMKRARSGHWFLPVGRYQETMTKLGYGHMVAKTNTPASANPSSSSAE